ncbi:MAG: hypothetical protein KGJ23_08325 [Euryarchaeota archaeon]|nr:hypothetical protein [Euryarchaeota archaeon]MDE1836608.1 hypothetical protein [Euryarchaeota archaeon]MDE1879197.1 hypothetical protein [Euryarchaeota archaeon]MDE2044578.1 hypothetical protein [Thermoplasmata archaeon]
MSAKPTKNDKAEYLRRITNTEVHFENLSNDDIDLLYELFLARLPELAAHITQFKAKERVDTVSAQILGQVGQNFPLVNAFLDKAKTAASGHGAIL